MQLAVPALPVPSALRSALTAALEQGARDARAWASHHPGGTASQFDQHVLAKIPPPPAGAAQQADLEAVRAAEQVRTPEGDALTRHYASRGGRDSWVAALREIERRHGRDQSDRARALLELAAGRMDEVSEQAKAHFGRLRPYQVDPSLTPIAAKPHGNASYPSGHTSDAYVAALVLSTFLPDQRAGLVDVADQVAWSRVYGGVHYPTDVIESARLAGTIVADALRRAGDGAVSVAA